MFITLLWIHSFLVCGIIYLVYRKVLVLKSQLRLVPAPAKVIVACNTPGN